MAYHLCRLPWLQAVNGRGLHSHWPTCKNRNDEHPSLIWGLSFSYSPMCTLAPKHVYPVSRKVIQETATFYSAPQVTVFFRHCGFP